MADMCGMFRIEAGRLRREAAQLGPTPDDTVSCSAMAMRSLMFASNTLCSYPEAHDTSRYLEITVYPVPVSWPDPDISWRAERHSSSQAKTISKIECRASLYDLLLRPMGARVSGPVEVHR